MQPAPLVHLVAYPQLQLVVTVDKQGLIVGWKAESGARGASFSLPTSCSSMKACDHPEGPFLLVSDPPHRTPAGLTTSWSRPLWWVESGSLLFASHVECRLLYSSDLCVTSTLPRSLPLLLWWEPAVWSFCGFVATCPCSLVC